MTADKKQMLKLSEEEVLGDIYYGTGCDACGHSGYKGRRGIYEMLQMNDGPRSYCQSHTGFGVTRSLWPPGCNPCGWMG